MTTRVIVNARPWGGESVDVRIEAGRIAALLPAGGEVPEEATMVDGVLLG